jgi:hypothetical protein
MVKNRKQKEDSGCFLLVCTYCDKYRNDSVFWEEMDTSYIPVPAARISHGICPECLQEHFPDEFDALCDEGRIAVKEKIMPDNRVLYYCFFIVSNRGYLFGDYDKGQRL